MTGGSVSQVAWTERAADRSPLVQRSRSRSVRQMKVLVEAAKTLILRKGSSFTTQELVKEAGVAMQTFYRHFPGKDQLLLAVIEDMIAEQVAQYEEATREVSDPVVRLRHHITTTVSLLDGGGPAATGPRFVTAEHWRLHQLFPAEIALATQPFADLIARELEAAREAGLLTPADVRQDAWLVTRLVMSVYHHYAFATADEPADAIAERLWSFCLAGLGGGPAAAAPAGRGPSSAS